MSSLSMSLSKALLRIDVDANYERNGFEVAIAFEIVGIETDVAVREVDFFLERTR